MQWWLAQAAAILGLEDYLLRRPGQPAPARAQVPRHNPAYSLRPMQQRCHMLHMALAEAMLTYKVTPGLTCLVCHVPEQVQLPKAVHLCGLSCSIRCLLRMILGLNCADFAGTAGAASNADWGGRSD